jgi:ribosomal protein S18 acetylase RimI-like enzyme
MTEIPPPDETMVLSPLTPDDIAEVMRIERLPGYEHLVGRFSAEEHAALFADPTAAYFGLRDRGRLCGFIIVTRLDQPSVHLRRIAVDEPGRGSGARLLRAVIRRLFDTTAAEGLDLDVALGNARAKHVYEREGFCEFRPPDDVHHFLSISRRAWADSRGSG